MVLKPKPKLDLKFILKGSKAIKIMKGSKSRRGLTQVKERFIEKTVFGIKGAL